MPLQKTVTEPFARKPVSQWTGFVRSRNYKYFAHEKVFTVDIKYIISVDYAYLPLH